MARHCPNKNGKSQLRNPSGGWTTRGNTGRFMKVTSRATPGVPKERQGRGNC